MRPLALLLVLTSLVPGRGAAQQLRPRSTDYLFVTTADDARALWVNPAGLQTITEASILAEFVLDRPVDGDLRLGQWTVGFNSRGFSLGYQRDRVPDEEASDAVRVGLGLGFTGGGLGAALTFYRSPGFTEQGLDVGIRYQPLPSIDVGAVVRHLRRPQVRESQLPVTGVAGISWVAVATHLQLAGEVIVAERLIGSGADVTYRGGLRVSTSGSVPIGAIAALDLGSNARVDRWNVGIAIGGKDQLVLLGSGFKGPGGQRLQTLSASGLASRRRPGRQF